MDLKTFLLARIAEDEVAANEAKDATGNEWVAHGSLLMYVDGSESRLAELVGAVEDYRMDPAWTHVERHDPARVLAECAAKRAIIGSYESCAAVAAKETHPGVRLTASGMTIGLELAMKSLAAVHADHTDYQPEWKLPQ